MFERYIAAFAAPLESVMLMNNRLKRIGVLVMAIITTVTMHACAQINQSTADTVCRVLEEKYGCAFTALQIGDRFNTAGAKLYLSPQDNPSVVFSASINRKTGVVTDNYPAEQVFWQIENRLAEQMQVEGMACASRSYTVGNDLSQETDPGLTPKELAQKYGLSSFYVYFVVDEEGLDMEKTEKAIQKAAADLGVTLKIMGYVMPHEDFLLCRQDIYENPEISSTLIEKFAVSAEFAVTAEG